MSGTAVLRRVDDVERLAELGDLVDGDVADDVDQHRFAVARLSRDEAEAQLKIYRIEAPFDGVVGMEHGNSRDGKAGEQAVIDAYVAADSF